MKIPEIDYKLETTNLEICEPRRTVCGFATPSILKPVMQIRTVQNE